MSNPTTKQFLVSTPAGHVWYDSDPAQVDADTTLVGTAIAAAKRNFPRQFCVAVLDNTGKPRTRTKR